MSNRDRWRERVKRISAISPTWWYFIYIYIYIYREREREKDIYIYIYIYIYTHTHREREILFILNHIKLQVLNFFRSKWDMKWSKRLTLTRNITLGRDLITKCLISLIILIANYVMNGNLIDIMKLEKRIEEERIVGDWAKQEESAMINLDGWYEEDKMTLLLFTWFRRFTLSAHLRS